MVWCPRVCLWVARRLLALVVWVLALVRVVWAMGCLWGRLVCWVCCRLGFWMSGWQVSRLVFVTRGAVAAGPGEGVSDLAGGAVWGLVGSAQS